jgi:hypothetical protein
MRLVSYQIKEGDWCVLELRVIKLLQEVYYYSHMFTHNDNSRTLSCLIAGVSNVQGVEICNLFRVYP